MKYQTDVTIGDEIIGKGTLLRRVPYFIEDPSVTLVMDAGIQTGSGWLVIAWV